MLILHRAQELEKLEELAVEKQNLTLIPEDLGLEHSHGKIGLNLDDSELKHLYKVSSKNV